MIRGRKLLGQAKQAAVLSDGVIIGSRIIQLMEDGSKSYRKLRDFVTAVRSELDSV